MAKKIELNKEIADKVEVTGDPVSSKFVDPKFGEIDFRKMTEKQAIALAKSDKFPYLRIKGDNKSVKKEKE